MSNDTFCLSYVKVVVISPQRATITSINEELDKLYIKEQQQTTHTFTVICYSGHGECEDDGKFILFTRW